MLYSYKINHFCRKSMQHVKMMPLAKDISHPSDNANLTNIFNARKVSVVQEQKRIEESKIIPNKSINSEIEKANNKNYCEDKDDEIKNIWTIGGKLKIEHKNKPRYTREYVNDEYGILNTMKLDKWEKR